MIIPFSRKKYFLASIGAVIFTCIFWFMLGSGDVADDDILMCFLGLILFGVGSIFTLYVALVGTNKPGIILDKSGITVNSPVSWIQPFFITWDEIESFTKSGAMLYINVDNPQRYIDKEENLIKKKAMQFSFEKTGAIFAITSSTYQISFSELRQTLEQGLAKYKKKK